MSYTKRKCDYCGKEYKADNSNLKRGWGLCCSKSCAAKKRERSRPNYDPKKVAANNIKRKNGHLELYARKKGYPSYEEMEESEMHDDGSWEAHGGVELEICDICNLRANYCRCGEDVVDW